MLTLQILSDLHLEKRQQQETTFFEHILEPVAHCLALLGDIGSPLLPNLESFLKWCSSRFQHVFYVPGNHEYHNDMGHDAPTLLNALQHICARYPNIVLLHNKTFILHNYAFIGTTLWSYIPPSMSPYISGKLADYRHIYTFKKTVANPQDTSFEFLNNVAWLEKQVLQVHQAGRIPIVLTHHTPSFEGTVPTKHTGSLTSWAYCTRLACAPGIIRLWCCGHTHRNFHHCHEGYELISNQYGSGPEPLPLYQKAFCMTL